MKLTKLGKLVFTTILVIAIIFTYKAIGMLGILAQTSNLYLGFNIIAIIFMFLELLAIGKIYEK